LLHEVWRAGEGDDVEPLRAEGVRLALQRTTCSVVQRAVLTGAVGPVVTAVDASLFTMAVTEPEQQLVPHSEACLEVPIEGEACDLVVHREPVQAVIVCGPVLVVVERTRIHQSRIGTIARVRAARRPGGT